MRTYKEIVKNYILIYKKYKEKHLVFRRPEPQEREFVFS